MYQAFSYLLELHSEGKKKKKKKPCPIEAYIIFDIQHTHF